jgi:hypothetical protein
MKLKYLLFFCISALPIRSADPTVPASPVDSSLLTAPRETSMSINFRKLDEDSPAEGGGEGAAFDAEAEEKALSDALIPEVPKSFSCEDVEKVITCKDTVQTYLTFRITYKVAAVGSGGAKKKIIYTVTVTNGLGEGQDSREFHGTYRVKFEKDEKGVNLKQKMAWIFGNSPSNDLNRPNFINDLRRLAPIDMAQVKTHAKINDLVRLLFVGPIINQGDKSLYVRGPCAANPQTTCILSLYPVSLFYMRAHVQVGRAASNYAVPLSNFNQVFPQYGNSILKFATTELGATTNGYPLNQQMAKSQLVGGLSGVCHGCVWGAETDQHDGNFNLFSKAFVFPRQVKTGTVDEKYTVVGVYYNFEGWNYQHVLLDSEKQQEEIMLNTNSLVFLPTFQTELIDFLRSNDYSTISTQGEVSLSIEDCKSKLKALVGKCQVADGADPATSIVVKCGTVDVLAIHEIAGENDTGFKVDFLLIIPNGGVPDSGFVLQKVNSFDQLARIGPAISTYVTRAQAYVASRWALL